MRLRVVVAAAALAAAAAGCGRGGGKQAQKTDAPPRGGTLRVGISPAPDAGLLATLAPARDIFSPPISELYRCCLLRTLVNYRGGTTEDGGSLLRPDLAAALPEVSDDGLTYTFRLKSGLHYAPPYEDVMIKAQDIVRGIEYALSLPGYSTGLIL